jgi:hypothetical protein
VCVCGVCVCVFVASLCMLTCNCLWVEVPRGIILLSKDCMLLVI